MAAQTAIPRWGLYMMLASSVIGACLIARQLWG